MGLFNRDKKESSFSSSDEKDFIYKVSENLKELKSQYNNQAITISCSFGNEGRCYVFADVIGWYPRQMGNKIFQETKSVRHFLVSDMRTGASHMKHVHDELKSKFGNIVELHGEKIKARIKQDKKEYKSKKHESLENISYLMEQLSIFEDRYNVYNENIIDKGKEILEKSKEKKETNKLKMIDKVANVLVNKIDQSIDEHPQWKTKYKKFVIYFYCKQNSIIIRIKGLNSRRYEDADLLNTINITSSDLPFNTNLQYKNEICDKAAQILNKRPNFVA